LEINMSDPTYYGYAGSGRPFDEIFNDATSDGSAADARTVTVPLPLFDQALKELTEYASDGCDHSVGICWCDVLTLIEDLSSLRTNVMVWPVAGQSS
jgi:hypothetical protein